DAAADRLDDAPFADANAEDAHADSADEHAADDAHLAEDLAPADVSSGPDDALGLYLRQMGAIPLLNRKQELELAQRLESARKRFRHAALCSWHVLGEVVATFECVLAGQLALDPTIDVVTSRDLSREQIQARMPHNV